MHDLVWLAERLTAHKAAGEKAMVSLMHANNEIGTLMDVEALSALCQAQGAFLHVDTVQTMAHLPLDFKATPLHFAACSAHIFHGPKGIGFAYVKQGTPLQPFSRQGRPRTRHRAGTENVIGIAGLARRLHPVLGRHGSDIASTKAVKAHAIQRLTEEFPGVQFNGKSGDLEKRLTPY